MIEVGLKFDFAGNLPDDPLSFLERYIHDIRLSDDL